MTTSTLYQQLAQTLQQHIEQGNYRPGDRLLGVRTYAKKNGVSVSTVVAAYYYLEDKGVIKAVPKSGFYVQPPFQNDIPQPTISSPKQEPSMVTGQEMCLELVKAANNPDMIQLGAAVPDIHFLPSKMLSQTIAKISRDKPETINRYEFPPGLPELRTQLARKMSLDACPTQAEDLLITNGCQEAIRLALRACANPGDVVAIESPSYYGLLQAIDSLELQALEIPTDPEQGISLGALEMALEKWDIKACVVVPNFSNPLGYCMSDEQKQALVKLSNKHQLPIIEDDIYGDLAHDQSRPKPLKSFDTEGNVIYCSSFSKTLSPGLRLGWLSASAKHFARIEYFKYVSNLATSNLSQLAVASLLASGKYERYVKQVKKEYGFAVQRMIQAVQALFPDSIRITHPKGGVVIWIELPESNDSFEIAKQLLTENVSIAPGTIFSTDPDKYRHFIRVSCATEWTPKLEQALLKIAKLIQE